MKKGLVLLALAAFLIWAKTDFDIPVLFLWKYDAEGTHSSSISTDPDGTLYFGSWDSHLYAITPDGELKWRYKTDWHKVSTAVFDPEGNIYFTSHDDYLYAVKPQGKIKWKLKPGEKYTRELTTPSIGPDGTVYVGTLGAWNGYLYAVTPEGEVKWRFKTEETVGYPSVASDGTIYFGSWDKYFYALTPQGSLKWKLRTGRGVSSYPKIGTDGTIYYISKENKVLHAMTPQGKIKWRYRTREKMFALPVIGSDNTVYFKANDGYLYALSPQGRLKWKFKPEKGAASPPVIDFDGTLYFGSKGKYVYALSPQGKVKWRFKTEGVVSSLIKPGPDGIMYFFDSPSRLCAARPLPTEKPIAYLPGSVLIKESPTPPVVSGGAGLARVLDAHSPSPHTWTMGLSFAGDRHGADHMNDRTIITWENSVFRVFVSWVPLKKMEVTAALGMGYNYLVDIGDLAPIVGLWDGELGVKYRFAQGLGIDTRVFIPLRDSVFGGPRLGGSAKMLASIPSSEIKGLALHFNLGGEYLETPALTWGMGAEYRYLYLNPYFELTGEVTPDAIPIRITPGIRIVTNSGISLYFAADFGINQAARSIDLKGKYYVDQISTGIAFSCCFKGTR